MKSCLSDFTEKSREAKRLAVTTLAGDSVAVGSAMGPAPPGDDGDKDGDDRPGGGDGSSATGQM